MKSLREIDKLINSKIDKFMKTHSNRVMITLMLFIIVFTTTVISLGLESPIFTCIFIISLGLFVYLSTKTFGEWE